ncbi:MAG: prepilin-type N-terminal cleavage/methylation domain-containing protein [Longimicrobiales bacterium]
MMMNHSMSTAGNQLEERLRVRKGFTLVEVLVALVLTAVVGAAVTSVFVSQNAFYDTQEQVTEARAVSRAATNMMLTELRAVETTDGILAAGPDSLRVKVPFALGVSCGVSGGTLQVSVLPVDSATWTQGRAGYGGYAWRDPSSGIYDSYSGGSVSNASSPSRCETISPPITTTYAQMNGRSHVVSLPAPSSVPVAAPVMLYQVVTYRFAESVLLPGERGLWRHVAGQAAEELAAPFDASARFRFFELNELDAEDTPPTDIDDLRGVELVLNGRSDRPNADGSERITPHTTAIFFRNRVD